MQNNFWMEYRCAAQPDSASFLLSSRPPDKAHSAIPFLIFKPARATMKTETITSLNPDGAEAYLITSLALSLIG